MPAPAELDRTRLARLFDAEMARFEEANPRSRALWERARGSLFEGVPMNWMTKWAGPYPLFVESAEGAHFIDVDGHKYVDFCLGDTGAMAGHSPEPTVRAVVERVATRGGARLALNPKELAVLEYLLAAQGRVVSAEELLDRVWDSAADPFTTTVKATMNRLRAKLGEPPVIETVPRAGYRI